MEPDTDPAHRDSGGTSNDTQEERARRHRDERVRQASAHETVDDDVFPAVEEDEGKSIEEAAEDLTPVRPFVGAIDPTPRTEKTVTRIEIPIRTIVTVAVSLFVIVILIQIWSILLQVVVAFLLATALLPLVKRLEHRGLSHGAASLWVFASLLLVIVGFFWVVLPPLISQAQSMITNAPDYLDRFENFINRYPSLAEVYERLKSQGIEGPGTESGSGVPVDQAIQISANVVTRLANIFFVLVLTFYLMNEGGRTWRFLSRYFTPRLRYRLRRAYPEISRVVSGYIIGQTINSTANGLFSLILLSSLGVPRPLLLAVLAAVLDAVPIVGVTAATIPAVLLALTVSWQTALIVFVAYVLYQQFENYVLVPRVFGNTLQVSALSILVGVLVGGKLLGIIGIILALPLTAAIPVLERVWNEPLPDDIVAAEAEEMEAAREKAEHPEEA